MRGSLVRMIAPVWRSYIRRNCRYFSFRASVSRLGFAPRVSRLLRPVASTSSTPLCVPWQGSRTPMETTSGVALLHSLYVQHWNTCSMFKLLFIANATRSRSTFGGNMVEYHMVRGPKPRPEMNDRIVAKIRTPFRASERAPFPTPRIFATLCQISALGANSF